MTIGRSWACQREALFCVRSVSWVWFLHAAEGWPEGQAEAMAASPRVHSPDIKQGEVWPSSRRCYSPAMDWEFPV